MERVSTHSDHLYYSAMTNCNLIVLSYHRFTEEPDEYVYSRTYDQFVNDLATKDFDWITIDDGHSSLLKACKLMEEWNIRGKIFISTSLIGTEDYCSWNDIWAVSRKHDVENHSHEHVKLSLFDEVHILHNIITANELIRKHTGRRPRYFVAPWNEYNKDIVKIAEGEGLQVVNNRSNIKNISR